MVLNHYRFLTAVLLVVSFACTKEYSYEGGPDEILPSLPGDDSLFYFQVLLEDSSYHEVVARPFGYANAISFNHGPNPDAGQTTTTWIEPNRNDDSTELDILALERGIFRNYSQMDSAAFINHFQIGEHPFGELWHRSPDQTPIPGSDGFAIYFYNVQTQEQWRSDWAPGLQQNSSFRVVSIEPRTGRAGYLGFRIKAEFSCTLYNETGASLKLLKGRAAYYWMKKL